MRFTNKAILLTAALMTTSLSAVASNPTSKFSVDKKTEIQSIVKEYLLENPEILAEMAKKYQQKQIADQQKKAEASIKTNAKSLFENASNPVAGNPQAKIVLVEFFDYQCGHCKRMTSVVQSIIDKNADIKVVYKELPIFGGESQYVAQLALAANKSGKYKEVHTAFMKAKGKLTKQKVSQLLGGIGVDTAKLGSDADLAKHLGQIKENKSLAKKLSIRGTPAFILATNIGKANMKVVFIPGATSAIRLQKEIDKLKAS